MEQQDPRLGRLRWQSRRGMKELDTLFETFFNNGGLSNCSEETIRDFERLLDCQDTDLLDWLLGRSTPQDAQLKHVVTLVRGSA
ncbi:succinate dehydrogenase assembly factor 2 [Pseudomonadota bacterium]